MKKVCFSQETFMLSSLIITHLKNIKKFDEIINDK